MNTRAWSRRGLLKLLKPLLLARAWVPPPPTWVAAPPRPGATIAPTPSSCSSPSPSSPKAGVGSGFAFSEDVDGAGPRARRIGFGGGSWPDKAHGLNRLGYIHETVVENAGQLAESRYFGFMSTSQEERLDEARNALKPGQESALFSAIRGESRRGAYSARFTRFVSKDAVSWRMWKNVASAAERSFDGECLSSHDERGTPGASDKILTTLLYALLRVRENNFQPSRTVFIYGGVQRCLETVSSPDPKLGEKLRQRGFVTCADSVVHMIGTIRNLQTGARTRFSVWWDRDSQSVCPCASSSNPAPSCAWLSKPIASLPSRLPRRASRSKTGPSRYPGSPRFSPSCRLYKEECMKPLR